MFGSPDAEAAPATVSGEQMPNTSLVRLHGEGRQTALTRKPGDLPGVESNPPSGVTVKEDRMTTQTSTASATSFGYLPVIFAALLGFAVITITGHVQAGALHDAAHDVRHATGFPCH